MGENISCAVREGELCVPENAAPECKYFVAQPPWRLTRRCALCSVTPCQASRVIWDSADAQGPWEADRDADTSVFIELANPQIALK